MEFREDVSFNLKGCSPVKLCALPSQGCLLVASAVRGLRMLDLVSGTQLKGTCTLTVTAWMPLSLCDPCPRVSTDVAMTHSNLQCCYHQQSGKLVVGGGRYLGVRGPTEGSVMLGTILQPPAADTENIVTIELPQTQVYTLPYMLEVWSLNPQSHYLARQTPYIHTANNVVTLNIESCISEEQ